MAFDLADTSVVAQVEEGTFLATLEEDTCQAALVEEDTYQAIRTPFRTEAEQEVVGKGHDVLRRQPPRRQLPHGHSRGTSLHCLLPLDTFLGGSNIRTRK